jgi:hypothetical protein
MRHLDSGTDATRQFLIADVGIALVDYHILHMVSKSAIRNPKSEIT